MFCTSIPNWDKRQLLEKNAFNTVCKLLYIFVVVCCCYSVVILVKLSLNGYDTPRAASAEERKERQSRPHLGFSPNVDQTTV